jgi:hypothetical protein
VHRSNEYRFDDLHRRGIRVRVDAPTVLRWVFDGVLSSSTANEFRLRWALNVAGLLSEVESEGDTTRVAVA